MYFCQGNSIGGEEQHARILAFPEDAREQSVRDTLELGLGPVTESSFVALELEARTFNNPNLTLKVSVAGAHFPHGVDTGGLAVTASPRHGNAVSSLSWKLAVCDAPVCVCVPGIAITRRRFPKRGFVCVRACFRARMCVYVYIYIYIQNRTLRMVF